MEERLEVIALAETLDNGKPIRETRAADVPLAIDHFRYYAGCIRAQEGSIGEIDHHTYAYHFHEPLGVVGQIIPWNFPLLMAAWKLAPALAAGNCIVLKPAEQTPMAIMVLAEIIGDLLPPGVLNIVNGFGLEAGKPLATNKRIAKIAFTGETSTGRLILQYAAENIIPSTVELGGKSPNIFFEDVMAEDDEFLDKALEGFAMFALNQGEVCTCPSRVLIQKSIYDRFIKLAVERVAKIAQGHPLDGGTMIGAQLLLLRLPVRRTAIPTHHRFRQPRQDGQMHLLRRGPRGGQQRRGIPEIRLQPLGGRQAALVCGDVLHPRADGRRRRRAGRHLPGTLAAPRLWLRRAGLVHRLRPQRPRLPRRARRAGDGRGVSVAAVAPSPSLPRSAGE
ncbi:aldehyde dehydrogenase family protein, partial [Azospirillum humicireducens]|uniref:aldehyde dehydrogenase family protein n=1 Tax=Azospirillum humicireducens TaxID=1226968 RepID=UPI00300282E5